MAAVTTDEDGWRTRVEFMREAMRSSLADRAGFSDAQADEVVFYLNHVFGEALGAAEIADRARGLPGHLGEVRRRGAQHRLRRFRDAGAQSFPLDRASRHRRQFLDPAIRGVEPDRALQSGERRDQGVSRPASGPGADPFGGAGAGRLGVAHRGGRQEARALGPGDAEDQRVPGRLAQAHHQGASGRLDLVDRRAHPLRSEDRRPIPTSRRCRPPTASRSTRRARSGSPR